jgi:hypothetical protein
MAWAAADEAKYSFLIQEYLLHTKTSINELRETYYYAVRPLQELYDFLGMELAAGSYLASIR